MPRSKRSAKKQKVPRRRQGFADLGVITLCSTVFESILSCLSCTVFNTSCNGGNKSKEKTGPYGPRLKIQIFCWDSVVLTFLFELGIFYSENPEGGRQIYRCTKKLAFKYRPLRLLLISSVYGAHNIELQTAKQRKFDSNHDVLMMLLIFYSSRR